MRSQKPLAFAVSMMASVVHIQHTLGLNRYVELSSNIECPMMNVFRPLILRALFAHAEIGSYHLARRNKWRLRLKNNSRYYCYLQTQDLRKLRTLDDLLVRTIPNRLSQL